MSSCLSVQARGIITTIQTLPKSGCVRGAPSLARPLRGRGSWIEIHCIRSSTQRLWPRPEPWRGIHCPRPWPRSLEHGQLSKVKGHTGTPWLRCKRRCQAVPASPSTNSTQHHGRQAVLCSPPLRLVAAVCTPRPRAPHAELEQRPAGGRQEAWLQADVARRWKFLDVHHSELHSWDRSQLSHQLRLGGGQGVSGRDPSADSCPKAPS